MPQFISNPYASNSDGGLASMLTSIGQSQFGDTARRALITQEMLKAQRENQAAQAEADAYRAHNMPELAAQGLLRGQSAADASGYNRLHASQNAPSLDDQNLQLSQVGAGEPIASTATGQGRVLSNEADMNNARIAGENSRFYNTPREVQDPNGNVTYATNQTAIGQAPPLTLPVAEARGYIQRAPAASQPSGPGNSNAFGTNETILPAPVTPDSTSQHFSPASLPPQTKPVPNPVMATPAPPGVNPVLWSQEQSKKLATSDAADTDKALGAMDYLTKAQDAKRLFATMPDVIFDPTFGTDTMNKVRSLMPGDQTALQNAYAQKESLITDLATSDFRSKFGARPAAMELQLARQGIGGQAGTAKGAIQNIDTHSLTSYVTLSRAIQSGKINPAAVPPDVAADGVAKGLLDPKMFPQLAPSAQPGASASPPPGTSNPQTPNANVLRFQYDAQGNRIQPQAPAAPPGTISQ